MSNDLDPEVRLAVLEEKVETLEEVLREVRASLQALEAIAQAGRGVLGTFRTILVLGGILGSLFGLGATIINFLKPHGH